MEMRFRRIDVEQVLLCSSWSDIISSGSMISGLLEVYGRTCIENRKGFRFSCEQTWAIPMSNGKLTSNETIKIDKPTSGFNYIDYIERRLT